MGIRKHFNYFEYNNANEKSNDGGNSANLHSSRGSEEKLGKNGYLPLCLKCFGFFQY